MSHDLIEPRVLLGKPEVLKISDAIMASLLVATSLLEWLGASLEYESGWERAAPSLLFGDERAGIPQYKAMDKIRLPSHSLATRSLQCNHPPQLAQGDCVLASFPQ